MDKEWKTVAPTTELRFIVRDGKKILQQKWQTETGFVGGTITHVVDEFRDVPLFDDEPVFDSKKLG